MSERKNLRGYKNYTILKNVNNPVMFLGLPLKLALFFLSTIMGASFLAMILKTFEVSIVINIAVPAGLAFIGITVVRGFYKKYGIKGFSMSQRDKKLATQIRADQTAQQILKSK